jgi:hypothetical protein
VAVAAYQDVFARKVASSDYREALAARPDEVLRGIDLTDRERRRLLAIAAQPGMRVNTAIHRANRLAPLDQTLPFTCFLLGDELGPLVERYWQSHAAEHLQLPAECERFARFLEAEIRRGAIAQPYVADVLAFERACTELRFFTGISGSGSSAGLPERVRLVHFTHDPVTLLEALGSLQRPPDGLEPGSFHLLIDCRAPEAAFRLLDAAAVAALEARRQSAGARRSS